MTYTATQRTDHGIPAMTYFAPDIDLDEYGEYRNA